MRVRLFSFGKDKSKLFQPAVDEYAKRLKRWVQFELIELPASLASGELAKADEAKRLLSRKEAREVLVALDERGKSLTSVALAQFVGTQRERSKDLLLCIGGDEGLHDTVLAHAVLTLSLSAMTLPHRLARVVLAEQLYRSFSILNREPYHK
jgi:23S rRNA (pseudouridine1915-N3)-methyltransferase